MHHCQWVSMHYKYKWLCGTGSQWLLWHQLDILTRPAVSLGTDLDSHSPKSLVKGLFSWHSEHETEEAEVCKASRSQLAWCHICHIVLNKSRHKHPRIKWRNRYPSLFVSIESAILFERFYAKRMILIGTGKCPIIEDLLNKW